jgi:hypothetical protein
VVGLVGAGKDLGRIYFVSEEVLGAGAKAGQPNLYLSEAGTKTFIATLVNADVVELGLPSNTSRWNIDQVARVSADGSAVAFISHGTPTDYDNTDLKTGEADAEVYLYKAGTAGPVCVSCNPSGARPMGRNVVANSSQKESATAGSISEGHYQLYLSRALSGDGNRVFFNSYDALLLRDTNGAEDVYEWERAFSPEACAQMGAEVYVAKAEGCLSLISSGQSHEDSEFLDASASGNDVFFSTSSKLVPSDPGLIDVYDARVGGGISEPTPPVICQGEACQPPAVTPNDPSPASPGYHGPGNVPPTKPKACPKGKHRVKQGGKSRCVKNKKGKAKKRTASGRAAR